MTTVIDCHCHVGRGRDYEQMPEQLLHDMDTWRIDSAIVCPVDRHIAVDNREGNDYVLQLAKLYPDRLIPFATANPWYESGAVREVRRALAEGARGIKLHPALQGFLLCDEIVYPLIEVAEAHCVPVYIHTGTPAYSQPMQLAELALRFPRVDFIMGHMGSTDFWLDALPAAFESSNIYVDTSWSLPHKVERALAALGPDRVLFGSDTPLSSLELELGCINALSLNEEEHDRVLGRNMLRLLQKVA
jgi:uncharacterized protein